jgi:hypothetical protein
VNITIPARTLMTTPLRRRAAALVACASLVVVLGACGSHRRAAATTTLPAPSTTKDSTTTTRPALPTAPLTGLPETNPAQLHAPAVVIKIDNVTGALPQTGINQADVVYEEMVEGGLTRLAAVFQSDYPSVVGPVRSGRLTDEYIADDLSHPVLVYAGTNAIFLPILESQPVTTATMNLDPNLFYRAGPNVAPHDLFSNVAALARLDTVQAAPHPLFRYLPEGKTFAGAPASQLSIGFPAAAISWVYRASAHGWLRVQNGLPDVDTAGRQVDATNVVVLFVPYITSGMATGEGGPPAPIPEGIMSGTGQAWFLSDGKIAMGTWSRSSLTSVASYRTAAGQPVLLTPGQTWVELVPVGNTPVVTP